ncbi:MAG: tRNA pseudouridine(38-40) synthase TruA [Solirubrobacteraceae bacterium]
MQVTKLTLAYDGAGFAGWARQPALRTVQEELERALSTILGEPVSTTVAGRTDAGVHAWAQVASYRHEAVDPRRLNALLPDDIAVVSSEPMPPDFDARHSATSRTYCYRLYTAPQRSPFEHGRALHVPRALDRDALQACAAALVGRHNFTAFTPTETEHKRFERDVLRAEWREDGASLEFWTEADSFMRQMIRVLVGTMLEVAGDTRSVEQFTALLEGAPRSEAGRTAPAHGLYLASVSYAA